MKKLLVAAAVLLLADSAAMGQLPYVTMMPVAPAPVVTYYAYPPGTAGGVVAGFAPLVTLPPRYYAASPVVAPAPLIVAPGYPMAGPPLVYGPRVVVHPKVYVVGQPIRNVLRAVTP
jgi:hypothetical protein